MNIEIITTSNKELKETGFGSLEACNNVLESILKMKHNVKLNVCSNEKDLNEIVKRKPDLLILAVKYLSFNNKKDLWLSEYFDKYSINYLASPRRILNFDSDKILAKLHLKNKGIKTAQYFTAIPDEYQCVKELPLAFPLFLKPIDAANGNGIDDLSFVTDFESFQSKVQSLYDTFSLPVLVEEYLDGKEFTVAVIKTIDEELIISPIEIIPVSSENGIKILGYKSKTEDTEELKKILDISLKQKIIKFARNIFNELNIKDYGRIDIKTNQAGECFFMEVNLVPGMTKGSSYFPKAFEIEMDLGYDSVVELMVSKGLTYVNTVKAIELSNSSPRIA